MINPSVTSSRRRGRTSLWLRLLENISLAIVVLTAVAAALLPGPSTMIPWDGASGIAFQAGGVLLLAALLYRADGPGLQRALAFARRGPTPWLLGLVVWGALSWALTPGLATFLGLLQTASGVLVYLTVADQVRRRDHYNLLRDALIAVTILVSLLGIGGLVLTGRAAGGAFFNHRSFGAFSMLMLPVMLMLAWDTKAGLRRTAAQSAAGLAAVGLLAARWTPAFRGEAVGLLVLGLLCWRLGLLFPPQAAGGRAGGGTGGSLAGFLDRFRGSGGRSGRRGSRPRRHGSRSGRHSSRQGVGDSRAKVAQYGMYGVTILAAAAIFLTLSHTNAVVLRQFRPLLSAVSSAPGQILRGVSAATTGTHSGDTPDGKRNTRAVLAMIQARPFRGWGIGSYPIYQNQFTHQGDEAAVVRRDGPQPTDRARDLYLKIAVELGLPGLVLWVGALALFFVTAGRALPVMADNPMRQRLLLGSLAAVAAQAVDAFSDPSWQYGGAALFLWILLGLGMAAAGVGEGLPDEPATATPDAAARGQAGAGLYLRFAAACVVSAVLLSQVMRAVH